MPNVSRFSGLLRGLFVTAALSLGGAGASAAEVAILNVSYDVSR